MCDQCFASHQEWVERIARKHAEKVATDAALRHVLAFGVLPVSPSSPVCSVN